jgi:DNA end-binding protein Ku
MANRPYWRGYLRLSLVSCPVFLYPASSQSEKIHFHQINRKTGNRLRQQVVDERTGKPVDKADKGRGYELTKGKYVEIDMDELDAVEVEATRTIDIDTIVSPKEIDRRYFDKPYYVAPNGKNGADAFKIIHNAMEDTGRVALARIVMAQREHVIALEPFDKGFLATTLRYEDEVREPKAYLGAIPNPRVDKDMVDIAKSILDRKAGHFNPAKFRDQYNAALKKLVKRKAGGRTIEARPPDEDRGNVVNLVDALRESIGTRAAKPVRGGQRKRRRA